MTRDLQEIKIGLAQARAALNLLEKFIGEYESRMVNVLPCEDVKFYAASDADLMEGPGLGDLKSLQESIRQSAEEFSLPERN